MTVTRCPCCRSIVSVDGDLLTPVEMTKPVDPWPECFDQMAECEARELGFTLADLRRQDRRSEYARARRTLARRLYAAGASIKHIARLLERAPQTTRQLLFTDRQVYQ